MIFTRGIYIDGEYFNIPIVSIKRNADFLYKFAERVETGELQSPSHSILFRCRQILVITNTQLIYPASLMNTRR